MATTTLGDIKHTKQHLCRQLLKEKLHGEYFLAAIVQDSLLYNLHHHADSQRLAELAESAAEMAVESVIETLHANEFAVSESIRGVMHTMVALGGNPIDIAVVTAVGGTKSVKRAITPDKASDYAQQIISGITSAAQDLGTTDKDRVYTVAKYVVNAAMA